MRNNSILIIGKAIERLGNRIEITLTQHPDGILLQSKQFILSEFLPNSELKNGTIVFHNSAQGLIKKLSPPFF
jgi:hypothetical protein